MDPPSVALQQRVALGQVTSFPGPPRISYKVSSLGFILEDTSSLQVHQPLRRHAPPRSSDYELAGLCESLGTSADVKSLLCGLSLTNLFQKLNSQEVSPPEN